MDVLIFLSVFIILMSFLSNLFRYLGQRVMERPCACVRCSGSATGCTITMGLHVGYFLTTSARGTSFRKFRPMQVVQFCITNTLLVAFRDPFMIVGFPDRVGDDFVKLTIFR